MYRKAPEWSFGADMNMKSIFLCFVSGTKASAVKLEDESSSGYALRVCVQDSMHSSVYFPSVGRRSPCQGLVLPPVQLQQLPVLDNLGQ